MKRPQTESTLSHQTGLLEVFQELGSGAGGPLGPQEILSGRNSLWLSLPREEETKMQFGVRFLVLSSLWNIP